MTEVPGEGAAPAREAEQEAGVGAPQPGSQEAPPPEGPYVSFAVFCQYAGTAANGGPVIENVMSGIVAREPEYGWEKWPVSVSLMACVGIVAGALRGEHVVELVLPPTLDPETYRETFDFTRDDQSRFARWSLSLRFPEPGLYWFDVRVGDRVISRIPFRVV